MSLEQLRFYQFLMQSPAHFAALTTQLPSSASRAPGRGSASSRRRDNFLRESDSDEPLELPSSSDEAEFSSSDDDGADPAASTADASQAPDRRRGARENRKVVTRADEGVYVSDEEDASFFFDPGAAAVDRLEHIFMFRTSESGIDYLVRFQDSPAAMTHWVSESIISMLPNAARHLANFRSAAKHIDEIGDVPYAIAHRRESAGGRPELLFRVNFEASILFFWDSAPDEVVSEYFARRTKVPACAARLPERQTFALTTRTNVSRAGDELRPYQVQGLQWLLDCFLRSRGSILADEMGLGKTIQALAFLSCLDRECGWHGPFMICVRTNTFNQWCDEIAAWTDLSFVAYHGGPPQRAVLRNYQFPYLDEMGKRVPGFFGFHILLASYDVILKDIEAIEPIEWQVVILDEGHRIKNCRGKKNNALARLRARHRIILTGTPIQNSLRELWTLLRFVSPQDFEEDPEFIDTELDELTPDNILRARDCISPHLLRRSLVQAERSIGPKDEKVVFVELTSVQRDLIRLIKLNKLWRIRGHQTSGEEMDALSQGNAIFRVCSHPFMITGAEAYYEKRMAPKSRL
jgi:hypothetical protein